MFSWASKKKASVAQSTAEAEHVSASLATSQAIWLRRSLEDVGKKQGEATQIMCDSNSSIAMAKNHVFPNRSKHIALKHHFF